MVKFAVSSVCHAFRDSCVGTKVIRPEPFWDILRAAVKAYQFPENGKGFIPLNEALYTVVSGVAKREGLWVTDFVIREWRGLIGMYAKRVYAADAHALSVIVYTADTYKSDPQVTKEDAQDIGDATHVVVAVLASAGPKSPLTLARFVANLAGGNSSYYPENGYTLNKAIAEAKEVLAYDNEWIVVAD